MGKIGMCFSGGAGFGAGFHTGVCRNLLAEKEIEPDHISGVSVGAYVAGHVGQYPRGHLREAYEAMVPLFIDNLRTEHVWKRWVPFGRLHGLWEPSLLNSAPQSKLVLPPNLDLDRLRASGRQVSVGMVKLETGEYLVLDQSYEHFDKAILGSAAMPLFFTPVGVPAHGLCVDGGAHTVTPLRTLIDSGCDEIYVSVAAPPAMPSWTEDDPNALSVGLRVFESMVYALTWKDIKMAQLYNRLALAEPDCDKRYVKLHIMHPEAEDMEGADPFAFEPEQSAALAEVGYASAVRATSA